MSLIHVYSFLEDSPRSGKKLILVSYIQNLKNTTTALKKTALSNTYCSVSWNTLSDSCTYMYCIAQSVNTLILGQYCIPLSQLSKPLNQFTQLFIPLDQLCGSLSKLSNITYSGYSTWKSRVDHQFDTQSVVTTCTCLVY